MLILIVLLSLIALVWLLLLLSPAHRLTFRHQLLAATPLPEVDSLPPVAVIVPARNEASMLPQTIPTICRQDYPDLTCILIDDQSDDDSPAVIGKLLSEHPNLRVIHGQERPKGWMGKCYAVKQGADYANIDGRDKLLLFTDADIVYHPQAVKQAVKFLLANNYDAVSLMPRCTFGSRIEAIGLAGFLTLLTCMFPLGWINDPKKKNLALAAGGFILFRKPAYEFIGGHEAVKHYIIEDINLAKLMKQKEMKIHTRFTPDLITTRMYEGFDDMWEGLTKNAYAGMEYRPERFVVGLIVGLFFNVLPPVYLAWSLFWIGRSVSAYSVLALVACLVMNMSMIAIHFRTIRFMRLPLWHSLLMPVSAGFYVLIAISSAFQHHYRGGNAWKGRRYDREMVEAQATGSKATSD